MRALACVCLVPALAFGAASEKTTEDDSGLNVKAGFERTSGKYGQARDTRLSTSSLTVTYETNDFSVDLGTTYLDERGPGRVLFSPGRRPVVIVGPDRRASGPGDVTAGVTRYLLNEEDHPLDLDIGAIVKFGTASVDKGLGTGKTDLSLQAAAGKSFAGFESTLTAGYTFVGKAPGLDLRNSSYASFDVNHKLAQFASAGATYSVGQAGAKNVPGSRDLTVYVDFVPMRKFKVGLHLLKGYSTQSPDRGAGLTLSCDL
jgi:hypothetical protein